MRTNRQNNDLMMVVRDRVWALVDCVGLRDTKRVLPGPPVWLNICELIVYTYIWSIEQDFNILVPALSKIKHGTEFWYKKDKKQKLKKYGTLVSRDFIKYIKKVNRVAA